MSLRNTAKMLRIVIGLSGAADKDCSNENSILMMGEDLWEITAFHLDTCSRVVSTTCLQFTFMLSRMSLFSFFTQLSARHAPNYQKLQECCQHVSKVVFSP